MTMTLTPEEAFDGETYEAPLDYERLSRQLQDVLYLMRDGKWRTLPEISTFLGFPEASVSARLRDFRKSKYGSNLVERERVSGGLFRYRLVLREA